MADDCCLILRRERGVVATAATSATTVTVTASMRCMQQQLQHPANGSVLPMTNSEQTVVTSNEQQPTTALALVERLKQQLLQAYQNGSTEQAIDVVSKLERCNVTKAILEMTRVGAVVNDIRKKVAQSSPELSKQCRALIKCWQKLAEPRPTSSGSSSTNGTPCSASPAVRKIHTPAKGSRVTPSSSSRLTPTVNSCLTPVANSRLTPVTNSRLTPAESTGSQSNTVSPASIPNGRTVTTQLEISVNSAESGSMRKSYTVGADLARKAVEDSLLQQVAGAVRNGKRKAASIANSDAGTTNGLVNAAKRPQFDNFASSSPTAPHQSLLAARRANVKSTSELVAQLTENLPGYLSISISKNEVGAEKEYEYDKKRQADAITGHSLSIPVESSNQEHTKKKEKRGRPKKEKNKEKEFRKNDHTFPEEGLKLDDHTMASTSTKESKLLTSSSDPKTDLSKEAAAPIRHGKYDWNAMLPSLETLRNREQLRAKPSSNPRKSYIMTVRNREVLALPYIDIGLPDFLEYQFPECGKFYAEENFMYGAPRPN